MVAATDQRQHSKNLFENITSCLNFKRCGVQQMRNV